uniref:Di-/tripeptide transporter n=1 Tax=Lygus hesperus TaxID=30085 RepID=A0A0A9Y6J8_LYGHE
MFISSNFIALEPEGRHGLDGQDFCPSTSKLADGFKIPFFGCRLRFSFGSREFPLCLFLSITSNIISTVENVTPHDPETHGKLVHFYRAANNHFVVYCGK